MRAVGLLSAIFLFGAKVNWFQASSAMLMISAVFWGVTRRRVVIVYRLLTREDGTDTLSRNVGKQLKTPRKTPEDRRFESEVLVQYKEKEVGSGK
jgi:hypothetical protein